MTVLIEIKEIEKRFGDQILLDRISGVIHSEQKVGLIGRNGTGKSTLARILTGEEEPDGGEVIFHRDLRLACLQQHDPFLPGETVIDFLMRDSGRPEWRCGEVAGRFEVKGSILNGPISALSGGWQTRLKLAALILQDPNLLLLDEPTNFLDLSTQMMLEECLNSFQGACLVISHDRTFLRATCNHTLELSRGNLRAFPGTVDALLQQKLDEEEEARRSNVKVEAKQRQLQTFINKNRAGANTASQARNKQKQFDRLELIELDSGEAKVRMRLPIDTIRKGTAVHCEGLSIGYPDHTVAEQIHLDLPHGERIAVVGDNGQGKTTFLRTLTGSLPPIKGSPRWGYGCEIGIYAQHVYTSLQENLTVEKYLYAHATAGTTTQAVLNVAGSFLFRGDAITKPIRVLSGGERARLCLAGLFLKGHNVLVLDEPVNHLDVETAGELAEALSRFPGTIIFTSHDRSFMEKVATQVVEVRNGTICIYRGDYPSYVEKIRERVNQAAQPASSPRSKSEKPAQKKENSKETYRLQKKITTLEREMDRERKAVEGINQEFLTTTDWELLRGLQTRKESHEANLASMEERWLALHEELS